MFIVAEAVASMTPPGGISVSQPLVLSRGPRTSMASWQTRGSGGLEVPGRLREGYGGKPAPSLSTGHNRAQIISLAPILRRQGPTVSGAASLSFLKSQYAHRVTRLLGKDSCSRHQA